MLLHYVPGCPANEANEEGQTPQKIAKTEGLKDVMKEVKKLSGFQDKVARGAKPKGFAEAWCVRVSLLQCPELCKKPLDLGPRSLTVPLAMNIIHCFVLNFSHIVWITHT